MKYFFVAGRNPLLSVAELGAVLGSSVQTTKDPTLIFFEGELPTPPAEFLKHLGGSLEIIEILFDHVPVAALETTVHKVLKEEAEKHTGKFPYALNLTPERHDSRLIRHLLPAMKKALRTDGFSTIFLNKDFKNVNRVFAFKEKLATKGANIHLIDRGEGKMAIGLSRALQNVDDYARRDYEKPFRDARNGMLPPKLAQIMINLAGNDRTLIVDAFCGTGTILGEALLMSKGAIGSDGSAEMVAGAIRNVDWTRSAYQLDPGLLCAVFHKDARELTQEDFTKHGLAVGATAGPLAIVTEPLLGPPQSRFPIPGALNKIMGNLEQLYVAFFKNLHAIIPKGTPVVFLFPYFKAPKGPPVRMTVCIDKVVSLGYSRSAFVPLQTESLLYDRPDQIVGRELVRFVRK